MSAYYISAPTEFVNTTPGNTLNFNSEGGKNNIENFVTSQPGDILVRNPVGTSNTLVRKPIVDTLSFVPAITQTSVASVVDVVAVADVGGSLNNTYFLLFTPTQGYYVWFNVSGGGTDPGNAADTVGKTGIEVAISTNDANTVVAGALQVVIDALPEFSASVALATVTITNASKGATDTPVDSALSPTGFTVTNPTPGVSTDWDWATQPPPSIASDSFHALVTGTIGAVPRSASWTTLSNTYVTWSTAAPGHNGGTIFSTTTGTLTISSTGLYCVSAAVTFQESNQGTTPALIPGRGAVRQVRIHRTNNTPTTLAFSESQANANSTNPTQVKIANACVLMNAGDTIDIQVRHDSASNSGNLFILHEEDDVTSGPSTYFSVYRVT